MRALPDPERAKPCVLVIDDDEAVAWAIAGRLGKDFRVVGLNEPARAVERTCDEKPSLILCDINMPGMDGGDVSKALHAHPEVRTVPVLFLTALISPSDLKHTGNLIGGRPAISKQVPIPELEKRIRQLIEQKA